MKEATEMERPSEMLQATAEERTHEDRDQKPLSRRSYVIAKMRRSEMKKLRRWLDDHDYVELATDTRGRVYLFNSRKVNAHHKLS